MSRTYDQLFVHIIWSTYERMPLITPELRDRIYSFIYKQCQTAKCEAIAIGGIDNHIHLLARIPPSVSIAQLAQVTKGGSSHFVTHEVRPNCGFKWQEGYGAFTVHRASLDRIKAYIANQEQHHQQGTLIKELEIDCGE